MSCTEDKKALPPFALPTVDPEADYKTRFFLHAYQKKLKTWMIAGAVFLVLLVTGATLLGVFLTRDYNKMITANRQLKYKGEAGQEKVDVKVEVDVNEKTETFHTTRQDGETAVMFDTQNELTAYKFSGLHICFVVEDTTHKDDDVDGMARQMENREEDQVEEAAEGARLNITLDRSRGRVDKDILSDRMLDFCKHHEIYWAVTRPTTPPSANAPAAAHGGVGGRRKKRDTCYEYYCFIVEYLGQYYLVCYEFTYTC